MTETTNGSTSTGSDTAAEPSGTDAETEQSGYEAPKYRGGHHDTSISEFTMLIDTPMFRTGWIPLGDEPDGPALGIVVTPPGVALNGPSHFHNTASIRLIFEGSMKIGPNWYHAGDIRLQQSGVVYGPESFGPEGAIQVEFFQDRRGMFPHYTDMDASHFGDLMRSTGIEPT